MNNLDKFIKIKIKENQEPEKNINIQIIKGEVFTENKKIFKV